MKYRTLIVAPFFTRSGYGEHAREVVSMLLEDGRFDVSVVPTRWGETPMTAEKTPVEEKILSEGRIATTIDRQPDLMFEFTVPSEFGKLVPVRGKKTIGMTAGIEASSCSPEWIAGVNREDLVFATSQFARQSLLAEYTLRNGSTLKATTPIEVATIGVDPAIFRDAKRDTSFQQRIDAIPENFLFLFVGHWLQGGYGEDRKDVARLIRLFCASFQGNRKVALVLKTSQGTNSISDRVEMLRRIETLRGEVPNAPRVYLIHGDLNDREMSTLYRHIKVKAFVSLTHGEGFMNSGLHFSLSGKPLILPGYSGYMDYLFRGHPTMKVEETEVPASSLGGLIGPGATWGTVKDEVVVAVLRSAFLQYPRFLAYGQEQKRNVEKNWTRDAVQSRFISTLDKYLAGVPFEEELTIPANIVPNIEEVSNEAPTN